MPGLRPLPDCVDPRRCLRWVSFLLLIAAAPPALAGQPPSPGAPSAPSDPVARARALFNLGKERMDAGAYERALDYFQRSLRESSSSSSTMNAAFCLKQLERYDEALEMSEDLLITFSLVLSPDEKQAILANIEYLRKQVGSVELLGSSVGRIYVDGHPRGELPREGPLHVMPGKHTLRLVRDGAEPVDRSVDVVVGATTTVNFPPPPPPPPPPSPPPGPYAFVTAFAGYALSGSLRSTAEGSGATLAQGFFGGVRAGYRLSFGVAFELSFGYLYVTSEFGRGVVDPRENNPRFPSVTYNLNDDLRFRGPFLGLGTSYRLALTPSVSILGRMTAGVISGRSSDAITGAVEATGAQDQVPVVVQGKSNVLGSQPGFLMPEIGFEGAWGSFRAGLLVGALFLRADGPAFTNRAIGVAPGCPKEKDICALPVRSTTNGEIAYGKFVLWVPQLMAGYVF